MGYMFREIEYYLFIRLRFFKMDKIVGEIQFILDIKERLFIKGFKVG